MSEDSVSNQQPIDDQPGGGRRRRPSSNAWMGGVILIVIGVVFLLGNVSGFRLDNWWALFILIPAVASLGNAWRAYRGSDKQFTGSVRSSLIGGLVLLAVAGIFLFNLDWGRVWPIFLVLAGVGALLAGIMR